MGVTLSRTYKRRKLIGVTLSRTYKKYEIAELKNLVVSSYLKI